MSKNIDGFNNPELRVIQTDVIPAQTSTVNLGSSDHTYLAGYFDNITTSNLTTTNQTVLNLTDIKDPIFNLAYQNTNDLINIGLLNEYKTGGVTTKYAGLMRSYVNGNMYLFKDATSLPTTSTDLTALTGASLYAGNVNITALTANKIVLSDPNKNLTTSSFGESDIVFTSTNQTIAGNKTFSGSTRIDTLTLSGSPGINYNPNFLFSYGPAGGFEIAPASQSANASSVVVRDLGGAITAAGYTATSSGQANLLIKGGNDASGYSILSNNNAGGIVIRDVGGSNNLLTCQPAVITSGVPVKIKGVTDGTSGASGYVGEVVSSGVITVNPTAGDVHFHDATSILLTAGDWMIFCTANYYQSGASSSNTFICGVSTTAGDSNAGLALGDTALNENTFGVGSQSSSTVIIHASISSSTTYYAKYYDNGVTYDFRVKLMAQRIR